MFTNPPIIAFALLAGHMLADYPLQQPIWEFKNRNNPKPGIPWYQAMFAHVTIHGFFVAVITGVWWLGALEAICHWFIDTAKCDGKINYDLDQALHITCKSIWFIILMIMMN